MYVKSVELSHFKSFGGTAKVPLLPGFTVISGPNGSGKSNILDAILFALGLSSSKGMRAERLPDLVNQNQASRNRSAVEANVTVTFALEDLELADLDADLNLDAADAAAVASEVPAESAVVIPLHPGQDTDGNGASFEAGDSPPDIHLKEWSVTRKLRVTKQGTYTSNYYMNGEPCTLAQLHEQMQRLRIYPEGYNVVLQGDVTSIISMNGRERREIIDELAGVASFDRKIGQAKDKLDAVKEREDRFRIVEKELIDQRTRLAQDRLKAEKYQKLRATLQAKSQWEAVLVWRAQQKRVQHLVNQIEAGDRTTADLNGKITTLATAIEQATTELEALNVRVKALGEDEHLVLQATLATREAELRQLQRQQAELRAASQDTTHQLAQAQQDIQTQRQTLASLTQTQHTVEHQDLAALRAAREQAQQALEHCREAASAIATASEAWIQEQTDRRHQIEALLQTLEPQRTEQARLQERTHQLRQKIEENAQALRSLDQEIATQKNQYDKLAGTSKESSVETVAGLSDAVAAAERDLETQRETHARLMQEQREKQRQLDKLEAQAQALQETQGTHATKLLLQTGLPGVCGLVAQLGRVDPRYQRALEIAAGGRLGYLVVEDDGVAAAGIELLKQKRAGRATFLPLNKIKAPRFSQEAAWKRPDGLIDYAVNLIDCEDRYREVFAYVFGSTVVFAELAAARRNLGKYRIVTLDGEILEASGAMTGGSLNSRQGSLHFGTVEAGESEEAIALRERLQVIAQILQRCERSIQQAVETVKQRSQQLMAGQQGQREAQLQVEQLQTQIRQLEQQQQQIQTQLQQNNQELATAEARLQSLEQELPAQEAQLQQQRQRLAELEQSQTHNEWQQAQVKVRALETQLSEKQLALREAEQRLQSLDHQRQRLQEKIQQCEQQVQIYRTQQTAQLNQTTALHEQQSGLTEQITQTRAAMEKLEVTLASEKQARDRAERQLRDHQNAQQQLEWQRQKLQETQQTRQQELTQLQSQLEAQQAELPEPLPEVPEDLGLEQLQQELRSLQKRLQAMEPVNMLALEEYERTQTRLEELSQKLTTLEEERTELLLRIENFTTLRRKAFREAFDAVNKNFQSIFAELSDGDGHLQLDDPEDPFNGGLTLVAHPKGKPVRRLASMSGGEKSLTALSFIFSLQRYRPSPFYAFDEVDMFLDGANVERLSRMIKHQSQQAQFIVVSLRRPMIEASQRTIGVTQARGAYTQVLGISLEPQSASV
ncbi:MAG: chromosome segregation protein SMC [Cyanothece sp. SIO1E1]|nr:chromosome segregation protein SMC [Cyanothece sp. SIO1E1]